MASSTQKAPSHSGGLRRISGTVTLALWQLHLTWRLLLVSGAGILAAVILVCTVPLYSDVSITAGLRNTIKSSNTAITITSVAHVLSPTATQQVSNQIQQQVNETLGSAVGGAQFSAQSSGGLILNEFSQIQLIGQDMSQAGSHLKMIQGKLPADGDPQLEAAITPQTARLLHLTVGSTFQLSLKFLDASYYHLVAVPLPVRIVGIVQPLAVSDPFWEGANLEHQPFDAQTTVYTALVSNQSYLHNLVTASTTANNGNMQNGMTLQYPVNFSWYYHLDTEHLSSNQLGDLVNNLNRLLINVSNQPVAEPFIDKTSSRGPVDLLSGYNDRVGVARIPLLSLAYLIAGLLLFFVSLMADLLVDRQAEAIAVLRSRGASRQQVFSALSAQSIGVGLLALLIGPAISVLLTYLLIQVSLPAEDHSALNILQNHPVDTVLNLAVTALITIAVSLAAMFFALNRASRMDVLAQRRESARSSRGPAWLRMGLDILFGIIALTGYAFTLYITSPGVLDARTRVLLLPPITLVGAVFLLLGCMLLFLRIFPFILGGLSSLATRGRGAASMLAVAQMARAPRQTLRMTLLLALAVAFGIFSLVFSASQAQRISTVASYQVGADFSGNYPVSSTLFTQMLNKQEATYSSIPGVNAASVGLSKLATMNQGGNNIAIELRAVDTGTYASVGAWTSQDTMVSLQSLMAQLAQQRNLKDSNQPIPAIVDATAWQILGLSNGQTFTLSDSNGELNYKAVAEVAHMPTVSDSAVGTGTADAVAGGGVLVDFQTYQAQVKLNTQATIYPSTVWLSTKDTTQAVSLVRKALSSGPLALTNVSDRRAIESTMRSDPLYLALLGVLAIGTTTALVLGLLGNLIVSWLSARSRLMNFAVMRALGTKPRQIASILTYEQVIVYATAIGLGVAFGLLLSFLILPAFIFTGSATNQGGTGTFYVTQSIPPIQMIIPGVLICLAVGILVAICILALGMMISIVSRPSLSTTLRLNSD